jgi:hypothetical protein
MPLQVSGSDRLSEGMEKIDCQPRARSFDDDFEECAARRSSRHRCQVDERVQYNSDASKGIRTRYAGLMKSRIFLRRTRQSSAIAVIRR